jgi:hypothetical protein
LYENDVPICIHCAERRPKTPSASHHDIRVVLVDRLVETTARVNAANRKFSEVMGQFPSGLPHPDGVQRIKDASNELTVARNEMMAAHDRLNSFLERGVVPDDLKSARH